MRSDRLMLLLIAVSVMIAVIPLTSDGSDAGHIDDVDGVTVNIFDDSVSIGAGKEVTTSITFFTVTSNDYLINVTCSDDSNGAFATSVDDKEFTLNSKSPATVKITVTTDKLSRHGDYTMTVTMTVYDYQTGATTPATLPINVKVTSSYSSDGTYNKILGVFDPLMSPYDGPVYTAGITLAIWVGIGIAVFLLFRSAVYAAFRRDKESAREIGNKTGAMLATSVIIYGLSNAAMVYGIDEVVIAVLQSISSFLYIPIVAYIVWNVYTNMVRNIFHRLEEQDRISGADTSLIPLFNMVGKIVIVIVAVSALLSSLGFDLVAIMTGAGIAGMAISLGAQSTLTEFFSGLNLLATRPFKRGDMIMVGGKDIYQVEKVGMLNSRFKSWNSMEYIIIPNSTVVSSTIMNITGKTMAYRISLAYTVAYDSDVELVKKILLDTAYNHPQVIIDGSYSKPSARLDDFLDSSIKFTLNVFITDFRDYIAVTDELNEDVYRNLCKAGIEIPFNKLDIYLAPEDDDEE